MRPLLSKPTATAGFRRCRLPSGPCTSLRPSSTDHGGFGECCPLCQCWHSSPPSPPCPRRHVLPSPPRPPHSSGQEAQAPPPPATLPSQAARAAASLTPCDLCGCPSRLPQSVNQRHCRAGPLSSGQLYCRHLWPLDITQPATTAGRHTESKCSVMLWSFNECPTARVQTHSHLFPSAPHRTCTHVRTSHRHTHP